MIFLKTTFILTVFAIFLLACNEAAQNNVDSTNAKTNITNVTNAAVASQPTQPADELASAREIYTTSCSNCHKEDGNGGKVEIDGKTIKADSLITDKMKNMSDEKYIKYIENGIPDEGMPAFKGKLDDRQIKDVVNYIRRELQKK